MNGLVQDLRYAVRQIRKNPGFTAVTVATLALGVGANTAIFSFVNALLFRPAAVENRGQLLEVWNHDLKASGIEAYTPLSYPDYSYYRAHNSTLSGLLAFDGEMRPVSWRIEGEGQSAQAQLVSGNFFSVLGVRLPLGRTFLPEEDSLPAARPVAILSHSFWTRRMGADPRVLGKSLTLNGASFVVIGVAPASFTGIVVGAQPDVWVPLTSVPQIAHDPSLLTNAGSFWLFGIGRLKPGITAPQAQANLRLISQAMQQDHPDDHKNLEAASFPVDLVPRPYRGYVAGFTGILMVVVGLVLLIACANLTNLLLAKASSRRREIGIRSALGATRGRLIRQTLTESLLLSVLGGMLGLTLAFWVISFLMTLTPDSLPIRIEVPVDWRVLMFTVALSLVAGTALGLVPALRSSVPALTEALKDGSSAMGFRRSRLHGFLVVTQVAVCLVLLAGAGLCVRSLANARSIDPGFETHHVLVGTLDLGQAGYTDSQGERFYQQLLANVGALPGVRSAALASYLPLATTSLVQPVEIEGHLPAAGGLAPGIQLINAGSGFLDTMGIPLLRGRAFRPGEKEVVVINEAMAQSYWPGQDPVGRSFGVAGQRVQIVGVAKTGKYRTLSEDAQPFMYLPMTYRSRQTIVVRTDSDPKAWLSPVRHEIRLLDPNLVPADLETMEQYMALPLFPARTTGLLLGTSGLLALGLATIGLYGVISYTVSQRTREIGIQIALGAKQTDVLKGVVRGGLSLTLMGMVLGLAGALAVTRVLSSLLYGIGTTDTLTFAGVSTLLLLVALLASYIPGRRASRLDPMVALRYE